MTTATTTGTTGTTTTTTATATSARTLVSPTGWTHDDGTELGKAPAGRARLGVLAVPMALLAALAGWVDHDADGV